MLLHFNSINGSQSVLFRSDLSIRALPLQKGRASCSQMCEESVAMAEATKLLPSRPTLAASINPHQTEPLDLFSAFSPSGSDIAVVDKEGSRVFWSNFKGTPS